MPFDEDRERFDPQSLGYFVQLDDIALVRDLDVRIVNPVQHCGEQEMLQGQK